MRWILFGLSALALVQAALFYEQATTIMQQIAAILIFVLAGILFTGAAVVDAVVSVKKEIAKQNKQQKVAEG